MPPPNRPLVLCDSVPALRGFVEILSDLGIDEEVFAIGASPENPDVESLRRVAPGLTVVDVADVGSPRPDLIISLHAKQLFPPDLVAAVKCINVHPGYNPYNRGWLPHVFSIVNGLQAGVTIHEMDGKIDHGPIIAQVEVPLHPWDTSFSAYERVMSAERDLLRDHLASILAGTYTTRHPATEGNLNSKADFAHLCELDLDEPMTLGQAIDRLRALSHGPIPNAYFVDPAGERVFVTVDLLRKSRKD